MDAEIMAGRVNVYSIMEQAISIELKYTKDAM